MNRSQLIEALKGDPIRLARYDINNDGEIGDDEWGLVQRLASNEIEYRNRRTNETRYVLLDDEFRIGDYHVLGVLGEGGQATTYLCRSQKTEDYVVLKERRLSDVGEWKVVELFEREAKTLASLDHPSIPKYVDTFEIDNDGDLRLYIAQTFVSGNNLEQEIAESGPFTSDKLDAFFHQMREVLGYLHDRAVPIIHRDIKPSNIIVDADGRYHLIDFGSVQINAMETVGGSTVTGTFGYAPLEQFTGHAVPASDIYSLGVTTLELKTGTAPFDWQMANGQVVLDQFKLDEPEAIQWKRILSPFPDPRPTLAGMAGWSWGGETQVATISLKNDGALVAGTAATVELSLRLFTEKITSTGIWYLPHQSLSRANISAPTNESAALFFTIGLIAICVGAFLTPELGFVIALIGLLCFFGAMSKLGSAGMNASTVERFKRSEAVFSVTPKYISVGGKKRQWDSIIASGSNLIVRSSKGRELVVNVGDVGVAVRIENSAEQLKRLGEIRYYPKRLEAK